jgi:hypothetical protein
MTRGSRLRAALGAALLWLAALAPAQAQSVLFATGVGSGPGAGLSALYTVDPFTGASTLLWNFPGIHIYAGGLAYDAAGDTLYATGVEDSSTGTSRLFAIDRFTGAVTSFPGIDSSINLSSGGLAIHPQSGVMYATGSNGFQSHALFTIDTSTGAATLIGQAGGQCCTAPFGFNLNGLGFRNDGTLFANGFTLDATTSEAAYSHLFTVNLQTGAASDIGSHGVTVGRQLAYSGLAFRDDGTLLSLGSMSASAGGLYSVDPATGAATLLGATLVQYGVDGGLAFAPLVAIPEPQTYALLLAGLGLLGFAAKCRRRSLRAA